MYIQGDGGAMGINAISFGHIGMRKSHSIPLYGMATKQEMLQLYSASFTHDTLLFNLWMVPVPALSTIYSFIVQL